MENKTVVVIGAVNMDICGRPDKKPIARDSNPGSVTLSPGGVGRNIAHNLSLLGVEVKFVAAIGDDMYGDIVYKSCVELGFDMHLCRRMSNFATSSYLYITDEKGEMQLAVCNADIADCINPEYLERHIVEINSADAVVIDGNLSGKTVAWIAENVTAPLYADPVSVVKAERLRPVLRKLEAIKPNDIEAVHMTGERTPMRAAEALLRKGVKRVFVSLGADGIVAAEGDMVVKLPCKKVRIVNTTGAGDAATAAIIWAGVNGLELDEAAEAAMKAAALALECESSINPGLREELIR